MSPAGVMRLMASNWARMENEAYTPMQAPAAAAGAGSTALSKTIALRITTAYTSHRATAATVSGAGPTPNNTAVRAMHSPVATTAATATTRSWDSHLASTKAPLDSGLASARAAVPLRTSELTMPP